eukprot:gene7777-9912_t
MWELACLRCRRLGLAGHSEEMPSQASQLPHKPAPQGNGVAWSDADEPSMKSKSPAWPTLSRMVAALIGDDAADAPPGDEDFASPKLRTRTDWIVDRLLKIGAPVAIFLDEFQVLTNKSLLAFFRELFEHVPANVRIFVGSRSVPDIGMAKLL